MKSLLKVEMMENVNESVISLDGENRFTQNEPIRDFLILIKRYIKRSYIFRKF